MQARLRDVELPDLRVRRADSRHGGRREKGPEKFTSPHSQRSVLPSLDHVCFGQIMVFIQLEMRIGKDVKMEREKERETETKKSDLNA